MKRADERETLLLNTLRLRKHIAIAEAVDLLGISEATARRLFSQLEREGKAIRNYGGIKLPVVMDNYSFDRHKEVMESEKRRIGTVAAGLVESGDSIYLDCGTTVMKMAEALSQRIAAGEVSSLNIITNSIANLDVLADSPGCRVILLGGEYNHRRRDFSGPTSEKCMELFYFKKCFLGSEGYSVRSGFSSNHLGLCSMNAKAIDRSEKCYVLMDCSKFGSEALTSYAETSKIDTIITDSRPEEGVWSEISALGVEILVASAQTGKAENRGTEDQNPVL